MTRSSADTTWRIGQNSIKQQAKDHPRFRDICISVAQTVHRTDMRIRLNLLRDNSLIEKAEVAEEARKKVEKVEKQEDSISKQAMDSLKDSTANASKPSSPASPTTADSGNSSQPSHTTSSSPVSSSKRRTVHIRPLSDAKAIERGATFISEFFLFSVAGGLILFEAIRSRKKELNRRDEVADRLQNLEEVDEIWRRKVDMLERSLEAAGVKLVAELPPEPEVPEPPRPQGWISKVTGYLTGSANAAPGQAVPPDLNQKGTTASTTDGP